MMCRYWIAVASREHVQRGVAGGFAQVCHGKPGPLNQMREGDWILYYSPTELFQGKERCQKFTAIGRIAKGSAYPFEISKEFIPWRRDVTFLSITETPIQPLLTGLSFIRDVKKWGFPFRKGCFEIQNGDFELIAKAAGVVPHGQECQFQRNQRT